MTTQCSRVHIDINLHAIHVWLPYPFPKLVLVQQYYKWDCWLQKFMWIHEKNCWLYDKKWLQVILWMKIQVLDVFFIKKWNECEYSKPDKPSVKLQVAIKSFTRTTYATDHLPSNWLKYLNTKSLAGIRIQFYWKIILKICTQT